MHASHWLAGSSSRQPWLLIGPYLCNARTDLNDVLRFTHRNGLVEAAEDGDHVPHVEHPLVLAAEAVRVECFDSNIQRQEVNWKRQLWVDFIFILLPIEIKYFWSPLFGCNPMRLGLEGTNWAQNEAEKKWKVVDARPGQRYTCYQLHASLADTEIKFQIKWTPTHRRWRCPYTQHIEYLRDPCEYLLSTWCLRDSFFCSSLIFMEVL